MHDLFHMGRGMIAGMIIWKRSCINQCGKPFFSITRQNGEWTEISTRQNEIELAMFGE